MTVTDCGQMEASCRITMAQQAWQINGDATMVVWISSANSYMWLMTWMIRFLHRTHAALLLQFDRDTSTPVSTLPIQDVNLSVQWKAALKFWEFYDYWKVSELDRRTRTRNVTHQLAPVKDLLELVILRYHPREMSSAALWTFSVKRTVKLMLNCKP